ncbi:hypothetical protein C8R44DRAFT_891287 [Mycena epipterygia]|nr:hypothetical protein C8R44DRAFT_891287 [Mycena epipterygia]
MFKPAFYVFCFAALAQYVAGSPVPSPTANLVASDAILTRTPNLNPTHLTVPVESVAPSASSAAVCPGGACGTFTASDAILTRTPNLRPTHLAVPVESAAPATSSDAACPGGACGTRHLQSLIFEYV